LDFTVPGAGGCVWPGVTCSTFGLAALGCCGAGAGVGAGVEAGGLVCDGAGCCAKTGVVAAAAMLAVRRSDCARERKPMETSGYRIIAAIVEAAHQK
jgi:hypothetical protein